MPGEWNFEIPQGKTFDVTLTWSIGGEEVDLTGWSAEMQIRRRHTSAEPILTLTSDVDGGLTLGDTAGTIRIFVSDEDTAALTPTTAVHDLELTSPGGNVTGLVEGTVRITPEVTREDAA